MLKFPKINDKKIGERSKKSQEKFADQCMTVSTTIINAVFVAAFVFPFVEFVKSSFDPEISFISFKYVISVVLRINLPLFMIVYLLPLLFAYFVRKQGLDIYDDLSKEESNFSKKLPKRKNNHITKL
jgi:hypothetical protein